SAGRPGFAIPSRAPTGTPSRSRTYESLLGTASEAAGRASGRAGADGARRAPVGGEPAGSAALVDSAISPELPAPLPLATFATNATKAATPTMAMALAKWEAASSRSF